MNLLHKARAILEDAEYVTFSPGQTDDTFYFEDDCVLGFVRECENCVTIVNNWESIQDSFLKENSIRLRAEPNKAWNVYSVFLTNEDCPEDQKGILFGIEEDFRGTRKIIRTGIKSSSDLRDALVALLPIQNLMSLETEAAEERLRQRLSPDGDSPLVELLGTKTAEEIARLLRG